MSSGCLASHNTARKVIMVPVRKYLLDLSHYWRKNSICGCHFLGLAVLAPWFWAVLISKCSCSWGRSTSFYRTWICMKHFQPRDIGFQRLQALSASVHGYTLYDGMMICHRLTWQIANFPNPLPRAMNFFPWPVHLRLSAVHAVN